MTLQRAYYDAPIAEFLRAPDQAIIGALAQSNTQQLEFTQTSAWSTQLALLKQWLGEFKEGHIFLEFSIPRMGKRADTVLVIDGVVFVIEFKVGATEFLAIDRRQTEGYALDLKNFHQGSHEAVVVPILVATRAIKYAYAQSPRINSDGVYDVLLSNGDNFTEITLEIMRRHPEAAIEVDAWKSTAYQPTPTIIEAAQALYSNHAVEDIARNDAGATNLSETSTRLRQIIHHARLNHKKAVCFVTGVPGSGKTLVGLNLATSQKGEESAVFLSGNGPLVEVLREALARDKVRRDPKGKKQDAVRHVSGFVQNIHHFRDEGIKSKGAPAERVVIFDEAQRAWDRQSTSDFMYKKHGISDFNQSEPEFLLGYMDRHSGWCVVVALVGSGQEIDAGEAGMHGWLEALGRKFHEWDVYVSEISGMETRPYCATTRQEVDLKLHVEPALHLKSSMRSFRSTHLSSFIESTLSGDADEAFRHSKTLTKRYPIKITRNLEFAKRWILDQVRGTESIGFVAHSKAHRLRAEGVHVMRRPRYAEICNWFLAPPEDVRSSHVLEQVATEYEVQGLEVDWMIVGWDANLRYIDGVAEHWKFSGSAWKRIHYQTEQASLVNSYRVLLTRARQGLIVFIPSGDSRDGTRKPEFYDCTFEYLIKCGFEEIVAT